jgi:hypothetical protein
MEGKTQNLCIVTLFSDPFCVNHSRNFFVKQNIVQILTLECDGTYAAYEEKSQIIFEVTEGKCDDVNVLITVN